MTEGNSWLWGTVFAGTIFVFLYAFSNIVFPFMFGAFLAYIFAPIVDKFETHCPRGVTSSIITILFVCFFVFLIISIAPKIETNISELISLLPNYSEQLINSVNSIFDELNLERLDASNIQGFIGRNVDVIISFILKVFSHGNAITGFFSCLIVIPVTMFYLMRDWNKLVSTIMHCIPYRFANTIDELSHRIRHCLWRFFRGQMCAASILAIYYSITLVSLSISHGIILGIITGLMSFIPFIGAICCGITAFIIGALSGFTVTKLIVIAVIYTVGPLIESYILTPRFVGGEVGLHPLWILFAFFAGIQIYGIIGVAIAIPCAAVIAEIMRYFVHWARNSTFFKA